MDMETNWQDTYNAAMDSVNLLNNGKPVDQSDEDWADSVSRNVEHLKIIVAKEDWPEGFDLSPMTTAIEANA